MLVIENEIHALFPIMCGEISEPNKFMEDTPKRIAKLKAQEIARQLLKNTGTDAFHLRQEQAEACAWKSMADAGIAADDIYSFARQIMGGKSDGAFRQQTRNPPSRPMCSDQTKKNISQKIKEIFCHYGDKPDGATRNPPSHTTCSDQTKKNIGQKIKEIFCHNGDKPDRSLLCAPFTLNVPTMIAQVKGGKPRTWTIEFGKAATARCGTSEVCMQFKTARLFVFRTGVVILDISWGYSMKEHDKPLNDAILLEANYLLSHSNHAASNNSDKETPQKMDAARLQRFAEALIAPSTGDQMGMKPNVERRVLYSLVRVEEESTNHETALFATRLSHRQSSDYIPAPSLVEATIWRPFEYLFHAASIESGASVIQDQEMNSGFITSFIKNQGVNLYLPLAIASLHNHYWLLSKTQWATDTNDDAKNKRKEKERIEKIYETTVEYRRNFHHKIISQVYLHNEFHTHWQKVLHIPERVEYQEQTARDVATLIGERRSRGIRNISGGIAGFLVTREILEALSVSGFSFALPDMRVWLASSAHLSPEQMESMIQLVEYWEQGILLGSLLGGVLGWWVAKSFDKKLGVE